MIYHLRYCPVGTMPNVDIQHILCAFHDGLYSPYGTKKIYANWHLLERCSPYGTLFFIWKALIYICIFRNWHIAFNEFRKTICFNICPVGTAKNLGRIFCLFESTVCFQHLSSRDCTKFWVEYFVFSNQPFVLNICPIGTA